MVPAPQGLSGTVFSCLGSKRHTADKTLALMLALTMPPLLLLMLLLLPGRSEGLQEDAMTMTPHSSSCTDRLDALESLLREQDTRFSGRLAQQEDRISKQEALLRQQSRLLLRQQERLDVQDQVIREQSAALSAHAATLARHRQQEEEKAPSPGKLLAKESSSVSRHHAQSHQQNQEQPQRVGGMVNQSANRSVRWMDTSSSSSSSSSQHVNVRADDAGPLEAVVNQLSQQVTEMSADIQTLKASDSQQDGLIQDSASSTFVHWGSSQCASGSQLVYSGVVGGSWYEHTGAATNFLCLTMSPVLSNHAIPGSSALLYGSEYQTYDSHYEKDAVCSVCRPTFSTTVMIPGTNVCTPGWHLQYSGFLMAGYHGHAAGSEYICVDSDMDSTDRGDVNQNGKLLYFTATRCGSLPCSPYVNNKIVTCAVCSK